MRNCLVQATTTAQGGPDIQFIDFEYSCAMQRGFDWVGFSQTNACCAFDVLISSSSDCGRVLPRQ